MAAQWIRLSDVGGLSDAGFYGWMWADPVDAAVMATYDLGAPMFTSPTPQMTQTIECLGLRTNYDEWKKWCSDPSKPGVFGGLGYTVHTPSPLPDFELDTTAIGKEAGDAAFAEIQPKLRYEVDRIVQMAHTEAPRLAQEAFDAVRPDGEQLLERQVNRLLLGISVLTGAFVGGIGYLALFHRSRA